MSFVSMQEKDNTKAAGKIKSGFSGCFSGKTGIIFRRL